MANEIQMPYTAAGQTLYAVIRDVNAQTWDNTAGAWEAYDTASLGDYDIPMSQQGTASRYYVATFPVTIAAGRYYVTMFLQVGGSPAEGDKLLGHDRIDWNGSAIIGLYTAGGGSSGGNVNVTQIEGVDATDAINAACDAAIETYGLDHVVASAVVGADIADNSIVAKLASKSAVADWDSFINTTDALEAIADAATTAATVADAVWDEARSGHVASGSFGEYVNAALTTAGVAAIWSYLKASAAALGVTTMGRYIYDRLAYLTSATIVHVSSLVSDGDVIELFVGGSNHLITNNAIILEVDPADYDLTGYTPRFGMSILVTDVGADQTMDVVGTVENAGSAGQRIVIELEVADTDNLAVDDEPVNPYKTSDTGRAYRWTISATDGAGHCPVLARGEASVKPKDTSCETS